MGGIIEGQPFVNTLRISTHPPPVQEEAKPGHEARCFEVLPSKRCRKQQKQIQKFQEAIKKCYKFILSDQIEIAIIFLKDIIKTGNLLSLQEFHGVGNQQSWNGFFKDGAISWLIANKKQNQQFKNPYDLISLCFHLLLKKEGDHFHTCLQWYENNIQSKETYELWVGLGHLYYTNKNFKQAESCYQRGLELNPAFLKLYQYLAWVYGYWFDYDSLANSYAAKYLEHNPESLTCKYIYALTQQTNAKKKQLLEEIIQQEPDYYRVYINLGEMESCKEKSKYFYNKCLEYDANYKFAFLKLGDLERFNDNYEEAERLYMKVKEIDELEDYVYFYLGCLSEDQEDYEEALVLYNMCLEINPYNADICATISHLYRTLGQSQKSIEFMRRQLDQNPYDYQNCNLLGIFYDEEEESEEAAEYFRKAITINSNYYEPYVNLGSYHQEKKEFEQAIKYYLKAIEIKEEQVDPYFGMAICEGSLHNIDRGIEWCFKCIQRGCDEDKQVYEILGDLYKDKKDYSNSLHTYLIYAIETKTLHTEYIESNLMRLMTREEAKRLLISQFYFPQFALVNQFLFAELGKLSLSISQEELAKQCFQKLKTMGRQGQLHLSVSEQLRRYDGTSQHIINNYHMGIRSYQSRIGLLALKKQFDQKFSKLYLQTR